MGIPGMGEMVQGGGGFHTALQSYSAQALGHSVSGREIKLFEHKNIAYASSFTDEHIKMLKLHIK